MHLCGCIVKGKKFRSVMLYQIRHGNRRDLRKRWNYGMGKKSEVIWSEQRSI